MPPLFISKFSCFQPSPVTVQTHVCQTWSETLMTSFCASLLIFHVMVIPINCHFLLQVKLFGRKFEPGEFDRMSAAEQQNKSDQMMNLIQKWREERRAEELRQGRR